MSDIMQASWHVLTAWTWIIKLSSKSELGWSAVLCGTCLVIRMLVCVYMKSIIGNTFNSCWHILYPWYSKCPYYLHHPTNFLFATILIVKRNIYAILHPIANSLFRRCIIAEQRNLGINNLEKKLHLLTDPV